MGSGDSCRWWCHLTIFVLRPLLAILFVLSLIALSWYAAWKTVLVHVPLVQEVFGLRKKPVKPKPPGRHRLSRFYNLALRQIRRTMLNLVIIYVIGGCRVLKQSFVLVIPLRCRGGLLICASTVFSTLRHNNWYQIKDCDHHS